jgi:DNA repair exonuclease SbcCD ATPase subunit
MTNKGSLIKAQSEWQGRIDDLQALITQLEADVVEAEMSLAEELTALNAFEFQLRAGVRQLMDRLDELASQIDGLKKKLRHHYDFGDGQPDEWSYQYVEDAYNEPRLDHKDYRFHNSMPEPQAAPLNEDETAELKSLYRQLARRFHPDMGKGAVDRDYRTQMMMAINAAYAAGDLERLRELALEPDLTDLDAIEDNAEQMVNFLLRELARLQRRLAEITDELALVRVKKNFRLMQQARRAEEKGQDWLAEIKSQLQEKIARKLVERDVLRQELEVQEMVTAEESNGLQGDDFADAVWDISLDATFDIDPDLEAEDWLYRRKPDAYRRDSWDEDDLD